MYFTTKNIASGFHLVYFLGVRVFLLIFCCLFLLLTACAPTANPQSTSLPSSTLESTAQASTSTPLPPGILEVKLTPDLASTSTHPVTTVMDLFIVLDGSRGMTKCTNWLYGDEDLMTEKIVQFLYTIFDPAKVKVHVIYLPGKDAAIEFVAIPRDGLIPSKKLNNTDNHYLTAFEAIKAQVMENYLVLMISDGAFNDSAYTGTRPDTKKWLEDNSAFRSRLYAIQPACSVYSEIDEDEDMWHAALESRYIAVAERRSIGGFLQKMIEETPLKNALPVGGQFVGTEPTFLSGKTFRAPLRIWGIWEEDIYEAGTFLDDGTKLESVINLLVSQPTESTDGSLLKGPYPECGPHQLNLKTNPVVAYYLVESIPVDKLLEILKIQIATGTQWRFEHYSANGEKVVWNPGEVRISAIKGVFNASGGASGVSAYKDCYSLSAELEFSPDPSFSISNPVVVPLGDNTYFYEFFKNEMQSIGIGEPLPIQPNQTGSMLLRFRLYDKSTNELVKTWETEKIDIRFFPQLVDDIPAASFTDGRYTFLLPFQTPVCQDNASQPGSCFSKIQFLEVVNNGGDGTTVYGLVEPLQTAYIPEKFLHQESPSGPLYIFRDESKLEMALVIRGENFETRKILIWVNEHTPAYLCEINPGRPPNCQILGNHQGE